MKAAFLFLLFGLLSIQVSAQTRFVKTHGTKGNERNYNMSATKDGGLIATGYTDNISGNKNDAFLIRFNQFGEVDWSLTYGDTENDYSWDVIETSNGDIVGCGHTSSFGTPKNAATITRVDSAGKVKWISGTYTSTQAVEFYKVIETSDGSLVATGFIGSSSNGDELVICKYRPNGQLIWAKSVGSAGSDEAMGIIELSNGDYLFVGLTNDPKANGGSDFLATRLDSAGKLVFSYAYGGNSGDRLNSVIEVDSFLYFCGWTKSDGQGDNDVVLMKTDAKGKALWTKTYGTAKAELCFNLLFDEKDSSIVLAGYTDAFSTTSTNRNTFLLKTDLDGKIIWVNSFGSTDRDGHWPTGLARNEDAGYYVLGSTNSFGQGGYDLFLIKTNRLGKASCEQRTPSFKSKTLNWKEKSSGSISSVTVLSATGSVTPNSWKISSGSRCCLLEVNKPVSDSLCPGDTANLETSKVPGYSYEWKLNSQTVSRQPTYRRLYGNDGTIQVIVRAPGSGCSARSSTIQTSDHSMHALGLNDSYRFCEGDTIRLQPDTVGLNRLKGDLLHGLISIQNVSQYPFTMSDTLLLEMDSKRGCVFFDSVFFHLDSMPDFRLPADTILCPSDSLLLSGPVKWSFNWNNDSTDKDSVKWISVPGTVYLTTINGLCSAMDSFTLEWHVLENYSIGNDTIICPADSLCLQVQPSNYADVLWQGKFTQNSYCSDSGQVLVSIHDSNQCVQNEMIQIDQFAVPNDLFAEDTLRKTGPIVLKTVIPWAEYLWSNGSVTDTLLVVRSGSYSLVATDSNGCTQIDSVVVLMPVTAKFADKPIGKAEIYPVPFKNIFTVRCEGEFSYLLYDASGRLLQTGDAESQCVIRGDFAKGSIYILELKSQGQRIRYMISNH